jgi:dynein heavy chain
MMVILKSLKDLIKALDGKISMTDKLDNLYNSIFVNRIPNFWKDISYPSLKPISSYL